MGEHTQSLIKIFDFKNAVSYIWSLKFQSPNCVKENYDFPSKTFNVAKKQCDWMSLITSEMLVKIQSTPISMELKEAPSETLWGEFGRNKSYLYKVS